MSDHLIKPEWWHYPRPVARQLDDSERNQLAELRHEACDYHCDECGGCVTCDDEHHINSVADDVCEDCCDVCYDAERDSTNDTAFCDGSTPLSRKRAGIGHPLG